MAETVSPPRNSTLISSMEWTTWAAVITLPSAEISTPEPVSLKRGLAAGGDVAPLGADHDHGRSDLAEHIARGLGDGAGREPREQTNHQNSHQ